VGQPSDGNFVEPRLLTDFGDLHSRAQERGKAQQKMDWKASFVENPFLLVILSTAAGLSSKFCEGTCRRGSANFLSEQFNLSSMKVRAKR
jgi:hypothetical protein